MTTIDIKPRLLDHLPEEAKAELAGLLCAGLESTYRIGAITRLMQKAESLDHGDLCMLGNMLEELGDAAMAALDSLSDELFTEPVFNMRSKRFAQFEALAEEDGRGAAGKARKAADA